MVLISASCRVDFGRSVRRTDRAIERREKDVVVSADQKQKETKEQKRMGIDSTFRIFFSLQEIGCISQGRDRVGIRIFVDVGCDANQCDKRSRPR